MFYVPAEQSIITRAKSSSYHDDNDDSSSSSESMRRYASVIQQQPNGNHQRQEAGTRGAAVVEHGQSHQSPSVPAAQSTTPTRQPKRRHHLHLRTPRGMWKIRERNAQRPTRRGGDGGDQSSSATASFMEANIQLSNHQQSTIASDVPSYQFADAAYYDNKEGEEEEEEEEDDDQFFDVSAKGIPNDGDDAFFDVPPRVQNALGFAFSEQLSVRSTRMFDFGLGPVKYRMFGETLVPAVKHQMKRVAGVVGNPFVHLGGGNKNIKNPAQALQKRRRLCVEIIGPKERSDPRIVQSMICSMSKITRHHQSIADPISDGDFIADDERVYLRTYKPREEPVTAMENLRDKLWMSNKSKAARNESDFYRKADISAFLTDGDEDYEKNNNLDDTNASDTDDSGNCPIDIKNWRPFKKWDMDEVNGVSINGKTIELRLGTGMKTIVRDFEFDTREDAETIAMIVTKMKHLVEERAKRLIRQYKKQQTIRDDSSASQATAISTANSDNPDETIKLLIEIVSATDLPDCGPTDPYVLIRMGGEEIFRTRVIYKTQNPVWTIRTGSLFLLSATPEDFFVAGGIRFSVRDFNALSPDEFLGKAFLTQRDLLTATGERIGYALENKDKVVGTLFLRIKQATKDEVKFMNELQINYGKVGVYASEATVPISAPESTFLKLQEIIGKEKIRFHRVRPYADPSREEETTWMSSDELYSESMKHSTNWTEVGSGELGTLFVEVLGCSDLPNMDSPAFLKKTDAFACLVFEDGIVNTDVIGNTLSPRWMPWSQRAFAFRIEHPSSSLFIGIFDYDPETILHKINPYATGVHDPIGRVEVPLSSFHPDTVYTVVYPLYFGDEIAEHKRKERGRVCIRFRKTWTNLRKAVICATYPAPTRHISTLRPVDYRVASYTAEGPRDDTGFSISKFTEYIVELQSYEKVLDYLKDFTFNTWLWRGHFPVRICGRKRHLPLHSITAFAWGILLTWDFNTFPSFVFFCIGWSLLTCNGYMNRHPSPWRKCPEYLPYLKSLMITGRLEKQAIAPFQRLTEAVEYERELQNKEKWMEKERLEMKKMKTKMQEELGQIGQESDYSRALDISTPKREGLVMTLLSPVKRVLYPIQIQMRRIVISLRITTSVCLWQESYFAFWITTVSFVVSLLIIRVPFAWILRWLLRLAAWIFLGPWMKLVDMWYFPSENLVTDADRDAKIRERIRIQYNEFLKQASNFQERREEVLKLKSMKNYLFGTFHVRVPQFAETQFKHTPLPDSYAHPYDDEKAEPITISNRVYGQHLSGDMIPLREMRAHDVVLNDDVGDIQAISNVVSDVLQPILPSIVHKKMKDLNVKMKEFGYRTVEENPRLERIVDHWTTNVSTVGAYTGSQHSLYRNPAPPGTTRPESFTSKKTT